MRVGLGPFRVSTGRALLSGDPEGAEPIPILAPWRPDPSKFRVLRSTLSKWSSSEFGTIGVRSPFFYFCNRPQIPVPTHTPNPRALAGGTLAVKN